MNFRPVALMLSTLAAALGGAGVLIAAPANAPGAVAFAPPPVHVADVAHVTRHTHAGPVARTTADRCPLNPSSEEIAS